MIAIEEPMFFSSSWSDDQSDLKNSKRDQLDRLRIFDRDLIDPVQEFDRGLLVSEAVRAGVRYCGSDAQWGLAAPSRVGLPKLSMIRNDYPIPAQKERIGIL